MRWGGSRSPKFAAKELVKANGGEESGEGNCFGKLELRLVFALCVA